MLLSPIGSPRKAFATLALPPLSQSLELRLPVELIFYIVELALASGNGTAKRAALSLCQVSTWVRETTLPIMYKTIILHGSMHTPFEEVPTDNQLGLYNLHTRVLASPFKYIEHLWLDVPTERCPIDFNDCVNLVQLALRVDAFDSIFRSERWISADDDTFFGYPPVRSFTVLGQSHTTKWIPFISCPAGINFLQNLTHLRILNMCLSTYIPLEYTPRLTHLCVPYFDLRPNDVPDFANLDSVLEFKQLQMIVITLNPKYWRFEEKTLKEWAIHAMAKDTRLFVVASTRQDATKDWDDPRRDWEAEASGGTSIWKKAVQVRRKFLQRLSRTFDPPSFASL
jgi:hypothetical protein